MPVPDARERAYCSPPHCRRPTPWLAQRSSGIGIPPTLDSVSTPPTIIAIVPVRLRSRRPVVVNQFPLFFRNAQGKHERPLPRPPVLLSIFGTGDPTPYWLEPKAARRVPHLETRSVENRAAAWRSSAPPLRASAFRYHTQEHPTVVVAHQTAILYADLSVRSFPRSLPILGFRTRWRKAPLQRRPNVDARVETDVEACVAARPRPRYARHASRPCEALCRFVGRRTAAG